VSTLAVSADTAQRIPLLDEVLRARFEELPDAVLRRLCSHKTLTEAMVATVETLTGITPRVMAESGTNGISHLVWCVDGGYDRVGGRQADLPGRVGSTVLTDPPDRWTGASSRRLSFRARRQLRATRLQMLRKHLGWAMITGPTVDAGVRQSWRPSLTRAMSLRVTFALWWDARMSEGHTPESATTLLALIAQPDVLPRFTMTAEGPRLFGPYGVPDPTMVAEASGNGS
jgi:hypothetical protein